MNPRGHVANLIPFKPGQSGNPGGRAAGARNRLQGNFLNALADHFDEAMTEGGLTKGRDAIERVWKKNPVAYIKAVASLMPKELATSGLLDDLADDDLHALVAIVKAARARRSSEGR